jgi:ribonuclease P protein component
VLFSAAAVLRVVLACHTSNQSDCRQLNERLNSLAMIHQTHRFHGRSSLRFAYQRGKTLRTSYFSLRYVLNNRRTTYRLAVVVSRKVSKSAVVRNRIRRRIYEVVRQIDGGLIAPIDLVISVYSTELATISHEDLMTLIREQFEKAEALQVTGGNSDVHGIVSAKEL